MADVYPLESTDGLRSGSASNPGNRRHCPSDPDDTAGIDKARAHRRLLSGIERLSDAQERLYAQNTWSVLIIFQAMDAAGKDSTIKHVMSGVNPQGVRSSASRPRQRKSSITTSSGARSGRSPNAAASASTTVRTTRK